MKKLILALLLLNTTIFWGGSAHALAIVGGEFNDTDVGTDVGNVDISIETLNFGEPLDSSTESETAWINLVLGLDTTYTTYTTNAENITWHNTDIPGTYAFKLESVASDYFIVKNATNWFLFKNVDNFSWGVFESTPDMNLGDDFTISHVTEFGGTTSVPEPSIAALIGIGLLGMIGVSRKVN